MDCVELSPYSFEGSLNVPSTISRQPFGLKQLAKVKIAVSRMTMIWLLPSAKSRIKAKESQYICI